MSWAKIVALGIALSVGLPLALGSTDYWKWGDDPANDVLKGSVSVAQLALGVANENPDTVEIEWKLSGPAQEDKRHAYILVAKVGKLLVVPKAFILISVNGKMVYRNDMSWKPPPLPSEADRDLAGQSFVLRIPEDKISADEWEKVFLVVLKSDEDIELSIDLLTLKGYFDKTQFEETSTIISEGLAAVFVSALLSLGMWTRLGQASLNVCETKRVEN